VLDVAAGNGMASLAAARRWCDVISTDYVPDLLERGKARAAADGWNIKFMEADAEELPFQADQFDVVLSTFGVMFTPNQDKAAAELLRVCKPKGKIGLANWTPDGFIGQVFKTLGKYLPPPAGIRSPAMWGTRIRLSEMFDAGQLRHGTIAHLQLPLPLSGPFPRRVQDVLRPGAEGIRRAVAGEAGRTPGRPARADRAHEPKRRPHHGGVERISRSRHHQALNAFSGPREPGAPIREGRATSTRTKKSHDRIL
jgi:SAM-dependent methyltransferase